MALPYVYRVTHTKTRKYYIGVRLANKVPAERDLGIHYFTSSSRVKPRFHEFEITGILKTPSREEAWALEQKLIAKRWGDPLMLNRSVYLDGARQFNTVGRKRTREEKRKISLAKTGVPRTDVRSPETTKKMLASRKWYKHSKETIRKIVASRRGYTHSEETRQKISKARLGLPSWNKGLPMREESRQKMIETKRQNPQVPWCKGKTLWSEADKKRQSDHHKGKRLYSNKDTGECRFFFKGDVVPIDWQLGRLVPFHHSKETKKKSAKRKAILRN